jgi:hypothetical protein
VDRDEALRLYGLAAARGNGEGWIFTHGVIPGIEPYSGSGNQLSRNRQGPPHGALQSWRLQWSTMSDWTCR